MFVAVKQFIAASKLQQRQENVESIKRFLNISTKYINTFGNEAL
jgi:hypothetical protein